MEKTFLTLSFRISFRGNRVFVISWYGIALYANLIKMCDYMKKKAIYVTEACLVFFATLIFAGCGSRIDYSLPDNPIEFNTGTFVNPDKPDDEQISIEYNGRTYIVYGTINGIVPKDEMGDCLGYIVQDGVKMETSRIFLLAGDPDANYLGRFETEGVMSQPDFFRAIDTVGKDITTPAYIDDLGYKYWNGQ